ncbi:Methyltransferase-like protein 7B [Allomyces arbusculus]|nr:Methyltransferase-like protein 7B [Allomyces arbusculus]
MAGKSTKKSSSSNKRPGPPPRAPPARAAVPPQRAPPVAKPNNPIPPASPASAPSGSGSWWSRLSPRGKAAFAVGGVAVYAAGVYGFYQLLRPPTRDSEHDNHDACAASAAAAVTDQPDRRAVYDEIALDYDREISRDEWAMGMLLVRRWMVGKAQGDTLEIAAGTGRNLPYYRTPRVTHLTLSDTSRAMLDQAANRISPTSPSSTDLIRTKDALPISLIEADATHLPFASNTFDTVVSTMSLCSVHDPTLAVREAVRVTKPGGRVLLVEHGRGHYDWLNRALDRSAAKHAEKWGCYFHRPIGTIVEAALMPVAEEDGKVEGMAVATEPVAKIASVTRLHLGTTWLIEIEKTHAASKAEV